ncbi:MAG: hypothetical protein BWY95_00418 [Bacteroidetes bacterium ADurb.BinA104]|nr:MAG: hypothetical protein BWY95_00418 [Bacteroidetes bacterium ADurb.BinA104]
MFHIHVDVLRFDYITSHILQIGIQGIVLSQAVFPGEVCNAGEIPANVDQIGKSRLGIELNVQRIG